MAGRPRVRTVVVSAQHDPDVRTERLREDLIEYVILPTIPAELRASDPVMHVNPTGRFVIGGPMGDAGLTGRKIIVDTYGGMARHGGGAFSGKDPTKVDRSGAYAARWVAKNVVAAGLADRFEIEVAYGIGIARPLSVSIETFGTNHVPDETIEALVDRHFDLRPGGDHRGPGPAPADLPADRRLRPLRPARPGPPVGAHRQGRAPRRRGGPPGAGARRSPRAEHRALERRVSSNAAAAAATTPRVLRRIAAADPHRPDEHPVALERQPAGEDDRPAALDRVVAVELGARLDDRGKVARRHPVDERRPRLVLGERDRSRGRRRPSARTRPAARPSRRPRQLIATPIARASASTAAMIARAAARVSPAACEAVGPRDASTMSRSTPTGSPGHRLGHLRIGELGRTLGRGDP